jgi:hypothetical protein
LADRAGSASSARILNAPPFRVSIVSDRPLPDHLGVHTNCLKAGVLIKELFEMLARLPVDQ